MIWIRLLVPLFVGLMGIYYGMLILQCLTSWFTMTHREITFGRCLIPFYYWIAPVEERGTESDYADESSEEATLREEKINSNVKKENTEDNKTTENK